MSTITLSTKVYNNFQLKTIDKILKSMLKGLEVETAICGVTSRGWVQIEVSGEDENVALHYLADKIGLCPAHLKNVEKFSAVKGYVTSINKNELYIDIGVFSPSITDATVHLQHLQAQLADGRKITVKKLAKLFGFCQNLPLTVKIYNIDKENSRIETRLSEKQLTLYRGWTKSLLDRLIILGASFDEVFLALKRTKCNRDVIEIASLGLFEHAIACKLGTDAVGLIPKIGKKLWKANFTIFNPRENLKFLGDYPVW